MSDETSQNQEEINRQLDEAHLRLQELAKTETASVEELKKLTAEQEKYTALRNISDQLEELEIRRC